jgi:Major Facilitator Superfamily
MVAAVSLGMIVNLYSEQRERARAIGAFSFVGAAGASVGLVLGGVLTEAISWHWIFFVSLRIPADRHPGRRPGRDPGDVRPASASARCSSPVWALSWRNH